MTGPQISIMTEQSAYVLTLLLCIYGVAKGYKFKKTIAGADLLLLGFLMFGAYAMLALTLPGIQGSYYHDLTLVATLSGETSMYFLSIVFRLGLVFVVIGIYRIGSRMTG